MRRRYYLNATDGNGRSIGTITIFLNKDVGGGQILTWEWQGPGINIGGRAAWAQTAGRFRLELQNQAGQTLAALLDGTAWQAAAGAREPRRPWFAPARANAGIGTRTHPGTGPQRLHAGFNWTLRP